jgi:thiamine-monophosphate kinase
MTEFDFIRQYLAKQNQSADVVLGIGDDAAIIRPDADKDIHISSDMLLGNRHFFADVHPADLAYKVLAVNLSDMAAMGATPRWALLSAALPQLDKAWLTEFCDSFFSLAQTADLALIGGDTTKGPLTFNITILGQTPKGKALKRSNAQPEDDIWVSGQLGLAEAALQHIQGKIALPEDVFSNCEALRLRPPIRTQLGQKLLDIAHAAQDISDGLGQDLNHILTASKVGATLWLDTLPSLPYLLAQPDGWYWPLTSGDNYELVFTAPKNQRETIKKLSEQLNTPLTRIGQIETQASLKLRQKDGQEIALNKLGFDHFG